MAHLECDTCPFSSITPSIPNRELTSTRWGGTPSLMTNRSERVLRERESQELLRVLEEERTRGIPFVGRDIIFDDEQIGGSGSRRNCVRLGGKEGIGGIGVDLVWRMEDWDVEKGEVVDKGEALPKAGGAEARGGSEGSMAIAGKGMTTTATTTVMVTGDCHAVIW